MPTSWNLGTFNDKREEILANDSEIPSLVPKNMSKVLLKDSSEVDWTTSVDGEFQSSHIMECVPTVCSGISFLQFLGAPPSFCASIELKQVFMEMLRRV